MCYAAIQYDSLGELLVSGGYFPAYSCVSDCTSFSIAKAPLNSSRLYHLYAVYPENINATISGA